VSPLSGLFCIFFGGGFGFGFGLDAVEKAGGGNIGFCTIKNIHADAIGVGRKQINGQSVFSHFDGGGAFIRSKCEFLKKTVQSA
jgi:hypothetical protein